MSASGQVKNTEERFSLDEEHSGVNNIRQFSKNMRGDKDRKKLMSKVQKLVSGLPFKISYIGLYLGCCE